MSSTHRQYSLTTFLLSACSHDVVYLLSVRHYMCPAQFHLSFQACVSVSVSLDFYLIDLLFSFFSLLRQIQTYQDLIPPDKTLLTATYSVLKRGWFLFCCFQANTRLTQWIKKLVNKTSSEGLHKVWQALKLVCLPGMPGWVNMIAVAQVMLW